MAKLVLKSVPTVLYLSTKFGLVIFMNSIAIQSFICLSCHFPLKLFYCFFVCFFPFLFYWRCSRSHLGQFHKWFYALCWSFVPHAKLLCHKKASQKLGVESSCCYCRSVTVITCFIRGITLRRWINFRWGHVPSMCNDWWFNPLVPLYQ